MAHADPRGDVERDRPAIEAKAGRRMVAAWPDGAMPAHHVPKDAIMSALSRGVHLVIPSQLLNQNRDDFSPDLPQ